MRTQWMTKQTSKFIDRHRVVLHLLTLVATVCALAIICKGA